MSRNPAAKGKADSNHKAIADAIRLHTEGDGAVTARMTIPGGRAPNRLLARLHQAQGYRPLTR